MSAEFNATTINLSATLRTKTGKGSARKCRLTGKIPASIYRGGEAPTLITIDPNELTVAFEKTRNRNTLVRIKSQDIEKLCLVKEVQRHPLSGHIRHVDFYNVKMDEPIVISVPVRIVGKSIGLTLGGQLRTILRDLDLRCKPNDIPAVIEIDISEMDVGQFYRVEQVVAPKNCEIVTASNFNVVSIARRRGAGAEADTEAEAAS
jgi:large subunit ribosomal protein L25